MTILDGKQTADIIKQEIAEKVRSIVASGKKRPHLAALLVGEDGASQTYVGHKEKSCSQVGFDSTVVRLSAEINQSALMEEIAKLNSDKTVDGIIVQLPLPSHLNEQMVIEAIDPAKDVRLSSC